MDLNDSCTEKKLFRRHAVAEFARRLGEIVHRAPSYLRERITPTPKNRFVDLLPNIKKREDEDLRRFADFLFFQRTERMTVLDKPDQTRRDRSCAGNLDYLVQLDKAEQIALEFTQIFEKKKRE